MLVFAARIAAVDPAGKRTVDQHIAWVLLTISLLGPEITFPRQVFNLGSMPDTRYLVNNPVGYRISDQIKVLNKAGYPAWSGTGGIHPYQNSYKPVYIY